MAGQQQKIYFFACSISKKQDFEGIPLPESIGNGRNYYN
jgi:hypothetical protein